ncbi:mannose-1-phosphate guanylyltransferase/mannose-6-phosphate isomerase [Kiloniella sp. EL199]|uniref:mannose-1-phosphate guanylyltransferase/mannose-6-phosphate isomerase n=1 Tax=Kiloniella sp. EL199 TaxID=2107581 RepID=UPI000EA23CA9|nr:mannose-1-phosphate guanylyltransferase/mannose-6-phosphate isomerase [Kiloniella sp. EL199]
MPNDTNLNKIFPVILCGGSGTRLWPVSRNTWPKQFIRLLSERSLLQETVELVSDRDAYNAPLLISNEAFRFVISEQMKEIDADVSGVVLEPESRDTAPAITLAALALECIDPNACMLVMPSDHSVGKKKLFHETVSTAYQAASAGELVTFGMAADRPETAYGYVAQGEKLNYEGDCYRAAAFIEKPDVKTAEELLASGGHHWNSGMFMFTARQFLEQMELFHPSIVSACRLALKKGTEAWPFVLPDHDEFSKALKISIDYALMERTSSSVVMVSSFRWSDIGSWNAIADLGDSDIDGNVKEGDALLQDCKGTYINSSGRLVTAIGLEDQIIIETDDAILVAAKDRVQDVKKMVTKLRGMGRDEADTQAKVRRPWGAYQSIDVGVNHQVKHITVKPGEILSYQYHHHRAEHWVVVAGVAEVTLGKEVKRIEENGSVYIPLGVAHRLHNPGDTPLHLIEVQFGDYLGEDDIVRLDDVYGRIPEDEPVPSTAAE